MTQPNERQAQHRSAVRQRLRRVSRLAAVQSLYEVALTQADVEMVILRNLSADGAAVLEREKRAEVEAQFYSDLVRGAHRRQREIDGLLAGTLRDDWSLERLDAVLQAILRIAVYELIMREDVPAKVVIAEYVGIADAFFAAEEPALVNGILDRLARRLRGLAADAEGHGRASS